jgi:NAD+ kinase
MVVNMKHEPRVLLVYKRSPLISIKGLPQTSTATHGFRRNHQNHYASLRVVENILNSQPVTFHKCARSRSIDYQAYDLIITVGGDGTFLEAARQLRKDQFILGVNSDPSWSVGQFCACDAAGFKKTLLQILDGRASCLKVHKLRIQLTGHKVVEGLNDLLICHANPAAMSRYEIKIGSVSEEHRSSGIWLSSAAGSTGAIFSAGGKRLSLASRLIQYRPRELYLTKKWRYRLKGGSIGPGKGLSAISHMTHGLIFVDGAHIRLPFGYGAKAIISSSPNYIQLIHA